MTVEVKLNPGVIARSLRLRNSVVAKRLAERTERTARLAQRAAPGKMGNFVSWKVVDGPKGLEGQIICDHPATLYVLNGTRPHVIRPRKKGGVLRFVVDGQVVYAKLVNHPGTKANPFLQRALREGR